MPLGPRRTTLSSCGGASQPTEGSVEPGAASTADLVVHLADLWAAEEERLRHPDPLLRPRWRAIISTPYVYAAEALVEGRGLLAEFDDPASIACCITLYLADPGYRCATEERALAYVQRMT
ncbi:MAG TPA: hypothetical protein VKF37_07960 [Chloroflexota bacterium]|nr:hypothetical protein [Chloroflexota bacterium]